VAGYASLNLNHDPREAAEVDRLIKGLQPKGLPKPVRVAAIGSGPPSVLRQVRVAMRPNAIRAWVLLGLALAIALPYWPYERACSWALGSYMFSSSMVVIAGLWGATLTWEGRLGYSHIIALGTFLWGLVLVAFEVLPRVGYAKATAHWFCQL
jgi:hypothetical protein